ncbi:MAG: hypothetical protein IPL59_21140 [Candidatus Competibacteraceae bacterium]|nr:hypothetical protein [Candidatus Competibacteraceae bacterium]
MTADDGMVRIRFTQNGVECITESALFLEDVLPIFMARAPIVSHHFETYIPSIGWTVLSDVKPAEAEWMLGETRVDPRTGVAYTAAGVSESNCCRMVEARWIEAGQGIVRTVPALDWVRWRGESVATE